jgi:hypothetical protein
MILNSSKDPYMKDPYVKGSSLLARILKWSEDPFKNPYVWRNLSRILIDEYDNVLLP